MTTEHHLLLDGILHAILEDDDDGIFLIEYPSGLIVDVNQAVEGMYNYSRDELLTMSIQCLRAPFVKPSVYVCLERIWEAGRLYYDTVHCRKGGDLFPVEVKAKRTEFEGKQYIAIRSREVEARNSHYQSVAALNHELKQVLREQSEQLTFTKSRLQAVMASNLEMEAKVRETLACFHTAFESSPIGMILEDLSGRFLQVNKAFCELLGYSRKEVLQKSFPEITHPSNLTADIELFSKLTNGEIDFYQMEKRYLHRDGSEKWGNLNISLVRDDQGHPTYAIAQVQDITSQKEWETELEQLASIIEHADNMIYSCCLGGYINSWNKAAASTFGYSSEEALGQSLDIIYPEELKPQLLIALKEIAQGRPQLLEGLRLCKEGRKVYVSTTVSPVKDSSGKVVGASMIARNITEQRRLEREMARLERLNLIGEMAAAISHEVRNPMTTVRGYLQILRLKHDLRHYAPQFNLMIEELDRMNGIISEFLSVGRVKPIARELCSLNEIIEAIRPLIEADALLHDKQYKQMLGDIPQLALDKKEMRQLILNLVRNGFDAMDKGKTITVQTSVSAEGVLLKIIDEGSGIPDEILDRIGTPFFSTKDNGTGLGLSVCYSIANRHSAQIRLKSGPEGTCFTIIFP